jgi:hypothetical protein
MQGRRVFEKALVGLLAIALVHMWGGLEGPVLADDDFAATLPTSPPIPQQVMMGGKGLPFTAQHYRLISPTLRKSENDFPGTIYVDYQPGIAKKVSLSPSALSVVDFLKAVSEQTGRRFAVQVGVDRSTEIGAADEDWSEVVRRFALLTKLELEGVRDIVVLSDPASVVIPPDDSHKYMPDMSKVLLVAGFFLVMIIGFSVYRRRPKQSVDPRAGWR